MILAVILIMAMFIFLGAMIPVIHKTILDNKLEFIDEMVRRGMDVNIKM